MGKVTGFMEYTREMPRAGRRRARQRLVRGLPAVPGRAVQTQGPAAWIAACRSATRDAR